MFVSGDFAHASAIYRTASTVCACVCGREMFPHCSLVMYLMVFVDESTEIE